MEVPGPARGRHPGLLRLTTARVPGSTRTNGRSIIGGTSWQRSCAATSGAAGTPRLTRARPLFDAVTGEEVARLSTNGVDFGAALDHGRTGRRPRAARADVPPARRAAQGARRAPARAPRGAVRVPRAPARRSATPSSTSTAASACCWRTRRRAGGSCPTTPSRRGRGGAARPSGGTFVGQQVHSLHGVAVQVNAFNFPVWGPLVSPPPRSWPACRAW